MFPMGPPRQPRQVRREHMPSRQSLFRQRQIPKQKTQGIGNVVSMFQAPDGNIDMEKVSTTISHVSKLYGQVSPMISPLLSRFIKK
ncbi:YppG family protein [Virgibacillus soli]|uniref:YppG family protein n=1 Tax=Paracerasibacillus soli TaxID=480284 RepID=A0ABU5CQA1_9BACI|nr:YppG family protein [Virgibacillus soli]MDY0407999.1 YppG family protein [Virgibacillus soli]